MRRPKTIARAIRSAPVRRSLPRVHIVNGHRIERLAAHAFAIGDTGVLTTRMSDAEIFALGSEPGDVEA